MLIYATVKSLAKKKNYITKKELNIPDDIKNLKELISEIVIFNVKEFNEKNIENLLVNYLTKDDINLQESSGKISFGTKYNDKEANVKKALEVAIQAFEDGLYKVFINEEEIENLEEPVCLKSGDDVAFIKFTMLAGRMW